MKKVKILDVGFDVITLDEALQKFFDLFQSRRHERGKLIVTPNPEMLLLAQSNPHFRNILNSAYLSIPDGIGILWASTFQEIAKHSKSKLSILGKAMFSLLSLLFFPSFCRKVFKERVTGVDILERIADHSRKFGATLFLLGAKEGVAEKVKERLEKKYPGVKIVGSYAGSTRDSDCQTISLLIKQKAPSTLFVAYGQEKQEEWLNEHLPEFPSVKVAMGVGGAFDFLAGIRKRAPRWMQQYGIEWVYRLAQEPLRIRRIVNAVIRFPIAVIRQKIFSSSRV